MVKNGIEGIFRKMGREECKVIGIKKGNERDKKIDMCKVEIEDKRNGGKGDGGIGEKNESSNEEKELGGEIKSRILGDEEGKYYFESEFKEFEKWIWLVEENGDENEFRRDEKRIFGEGRGWEKKGKKEKEIREIKGREDNGGFENLRKEMKKELKWEKEI